MINKPLKFTTTPTKNIFVSSDWHLGHCGPLGGTPLWKTRGYASVDDMTWGIIKKINELVKLDDIIFNLGDFCLNSTEANFETYIASINCQTIYCLTGNHNSCVKDAYRKALIETIGRDDIEAYPIKYKNLIFVGPYLEVVVNGQFISMCHYPIDVYNKMRHNSWMLSGHSHNNYSKTQASCLVGKRLDVSWDGYLKPLAFNEIQKIMAQKQAISVDHH